MDNTTGLGAAMEADYQRRKSQDQESRIRALELQVHTLTAAVQHLMAVTKPLIEIAKQAEEIAKAQPNQQVSGLLAPLNATGLHL